MTSKSEAWILLAHGSRDPHWADSIKAIHQRILAKKPGVRCSLAYMEMMKPSLLDALDAEMTESKVSCFRIFPLFLSGGGVHMTQDIPAQIEAARRRFPSVEFVLNGALGEDPFVQEAIATAVMRSAD